MGDVPRNGYDNSHLSQPTSRLGTPPPEELAWMIISFTLHSLVLNFNAPTTQPALCLLQTSRPLALVSAILSTAAVFIPREHRECRDTTFGTATIVRRTILATSITFALAAVIGITLFRHFE